MNPFLKIKHSMQNINREPVLGLLDLADKIHVKFEFQINNDLLKSKSISHAVFGTYFHCLLKIQI